MTPEEFEAILPEEAEAITSYSDDDPTKAREHLSEEQFNSYIEWLQENASRGDFEQLEVVAREGQVQRDNEARALPEPSIELEILHRQFAKHLDIEEIDRDVVEFALATYVSQKMPNEDPLWGVIVGASGSGKSEILRPFMNRKDAFPLSELTPKSLNSGFVRKANKKAPPTDPSLLPQMDGKVVIVSDLSPLLQMRPEARNEVFASIREAFDGEVYSGKGNIGLKKVRSRFTLLCASTPAIEHGSGENNEMGERFIRIRMRGKNRNDKARKVLVNFGNRNTMREELTKAVDAFIGKLGNMPARNIPEAIGIQVADLADFTAKARTHVQRDRYTRDVEYLPCPEEGTRLTLQLSKLLAAVAFIRGRHEPVEADLQIIRRVADDCLPSERLAVLNVLRTDPQKNYTATDVAGVIGTDWKVAKRILEDLALVGAISETQIPVKNNPNTAAYSVLK